MNKRLNVYIVTDLEGIAGIDSIDDINSAVPEYAIACEKLAHSINLTIAACMDAGADQVYYMDGHGGGQNVKPEQIDSRAIRTNGAQWHTLMENGEIDCQLLIGAHARAGTIGGFLDHTLNSKAIYYIKVNGIEMSEFSMAAIISAKHGIPFAGIVGDRVACEQAKEYVPNIFTGAVKDASCRNKATTRPDAEQILCDTVKEALKNYQSVSLISFSEPMVVEEAFYRTDICEDVMAICKEVPQRVDARTLRKTVNTLTSYYDMRF